MAMIKVTHILNCITKLKDAGADLDECVLLTVEGTPAQFYIMREKDLKTSLPENLIKKLYKED